MLFTLLYTRRSCSPAAFPQQSSCSSAPTPAAADASSSKVSPHLSSIVPGEREEEDPLVNFLETDRDPTLVEDDAGLVNFLEPDRDPTLVEDDAGLFLVFAPSCSEGSFRCDGVRWSDGVDAEETTAQNSEAGSMVQQAAPALLCRRRTFSAAGRPSNSLPAASLLATIGEGSVVHEDWAVDWREREPARPSSPPPAASIIAARLATMLANDSPNGSFPSPLKFVCSSWRRRSGDRSR